MQGMRLPVVHPAERPVDLMSTVLLQNQEPGLEAVALASVTDKDQKRRRRQLQQAITLEEAPAENLGDLAKNVVEVYLSGEESRLRKAYQIGGMIYRYIDSRKGEDPEKILASLGALCGDILSARQIRRFLHIYGCLGNVAGGLQNLPVSFSVAAILAERAEDPQQFHFWLEAATRERWTAREAYGRTAEKRGRGGHGRGGALSCLLCSSPLNWGEKDIAWAFKAVCFECERKKARGSPPATSL